MYNEQEQYLNRRKDEMECDMKRKFEVMEYDMKRRTERSISISKPIEFNPGNLVAKEVVCSLIVVVGIARLLGLV